MQNHDPMAKDTTLRVRLDNEDRGRLELLASHYAVSASTVVRMLVKRDADAVGALYPKAAPRRKARKASAKT